MIDPISLVGGSAGAGALIGTLSNFLMSRSREKAEKLKSDREERLALSGQLDSYQNNFKITEAYPYEIDIWGLKFSGTKTPRPVHPPFFLPILLVTATYCLCVSICFLCGDVPVSSQGFQADPSSLSVAWGLYSRSVNDKTVYLLTFAGLGTYFMSPLAFIITSTLVGIMPKKT